MKFPFLSQDNNEEIQMIEIDKISPNPYQPRTDFEENDIKDLAKSINNFGLIQPLTIRKKGKNNFELIAGERRLRAAKYINLDKVPCMVNEFSDEEMAEIALVENLQRKDLDFIEEALAYSQLIDKFDLTQKELADKLGKSQSTIANKLRLLKLPDDIKNKLRNPLVSERHARALLQLSSIDSQKNVINKVIENELTVRDTQNLIKKIKKEKDESKKNENKVTVFKDLRLFKNSLNNTIKEMKEAGLEVQVKEEEDEDFIRFHILLPRNQIQSSKEE